MAPVWTLLLLLLLLLLVVRVRPQSGDADTEAGSRISCFSHITSKGNSLTCQLLPGRQDDDDDEDDEGDSIESMTLCSPDWSSRRPSVDCVKDSGNELSFVKPPVVNFTLTVHLKRGGDIQTIVDMKKIVRPRPPQVWNVTFNQESNQAVVSIQSPYHSDYLSGHQLFQLHIWSTTSKMVLNLSSESSMKIDMEHLRRNTEYQVAVRAVPVAPLRGSWSEWSHRLSFHTPAGPEGGDSWETSILMLCLLPSGVVILAVAFLWKIKIFTYVWPSIPRPQDTLVHMGRPHKGLLLNFYPEVFSALRVTSMTQGPTGPHPLSGPADGGAQSNPPCSTQSSDCRSTTSASTEELDLSAPLSGSSSAAEAGLRSSSPSPVQELLLEGGVNEPEAGGQQEEAYVTMSSFYHVKEAKVAK